MDLLNFILLFIIAVLIFFLLKKEKVLGINTEDKNDNEKVKIIENKGRKIYILWLYFRKLLLCVSSEI